MDNPGLRDQVLLRMFGTVGPAPCPASEREARYTGLVASAAPVTSADRFIVWLAAHKAGCAPDPGPAATRSHPPRIRPRHSGS